MNGCFQANIPAVCAATSLLPSTQPGFPVAQTMVWVVPLSDAVVAPAPSLPEFVPRHSGVRQDLTGGEALASYRSLYLRGIVEAAPKCISGVRAISEFDWPFTPTHRSSESFSTLTGSDLSTCVTTSSSCPCVDHSVSRLPPATLRPVRTRFRSGSGPEAL